MKRMKGVTIGEMIPVFVLFIILVILALDSIFTHESKHTKPSLSQITKLSSDVSKLCLYHRFHLHNININITPQLKDAYSIADCILDINHQSCTCTIKEFTEHNEVHATTTCSNNKGTVDCLTKEKLQPYINISF